jgi:cold shock protein
MASGTVKCFSSPRGAISEDESKDIFIHIPTVEPAGISHLREGSRLTLGFERGNQGATSAIGLREI